MDPERARELFAPPSEGGSRASWAATECDELEDLTDDDHEHLGDAELDAGLVERYRDDLAAVERAEARLEAGTYGLSIQSGQAIPDARLEVEPTAELTVEEQSAAEGR